MVMRPTCRILPLVLAAIYHANAVRTKPRNLREAASRMSVAAARHPTAWTALPVPLEDAYVAPVTGGGPAYWPRRAK